jgi:hypothetical protein
MRYSDDYEYEACDEVEELYYDDQESSEQVEWENYYHNIAQEIADE